MLPDGFIQDIVRLIRMAYGAERKEASPARTVFLRDLGKRAEMVDRPFVIPIKNQNRVGQGAPFERIIEGRNTVIYGLQTKPGASVECVQVRFFVLVDWESPACQSREERQVRWKQAKNPIEDSTRGL